VSYDVLRGQLGQLIGLGVEPALEMKEGEMSVSMTISMKPNGRRQIRLKDIGYHCRYIDKVQVGWMSTRSKQSMERERMTLTKWFEALEELVFWQSPRQCHGLVIAHLWHNHDAPDFLDL
jgi:hypothetical protein